LGYEVQADSIAQYETKTVYRGTRNIANADFSLSQLDGLGNSA